MKTLAHEIIKKYESKDPYEIAKKCKIQIILEPLGNIQGYYNVVDNQKFIHVNDSLPEYYRKHVVSCLLYKSFTAGDLLFLKRKQSDKFTEDEMKANAFAFYLGSNGNLKVSDLTEDYDLSIDDVDDLFNRLYRIWDSNKTKSRQELLDYIGKQFNL